MPAPVIQCYAKLLFCYVCENKELRRFDQRQDRIDVMEIKSLKSKEKELLEAVLAKTHWNLEKTSRLIKISVSQIKRKIKAYEIIKPQNT